MSAAAADPAQRSAGGRRLRAAARRTARDRLCARLVRRARGGERPPQSGPFRAGRLGRDDRPRRAADRSLDRGDARDPRRPWRHRCLNRAADGAGQRADRAGADRRRRGFIAVGGGSGRAGDRRRRGRAQWFACGVCTDPAHRRDAWNLPHLHRSHAHHCARSDRDRAALDPKSVRRALDRSSARARRSVARDQAASVLRPADGGRQRRPRRLYRGRSRSPWSVSCRTAFLAFSPARRDSCSPR